MKSRLQELLEQSFATLKATHQWSDDITPNLRIDLSKDQNHGDFASSIALSLAKPLAAKPLDIAQLFQAQLLIHGADIIERIDIAGPGFINFFIIKGQVEQEVLSRIIEQQHDYGRKTLENPLKIQVEFVSANPTGPLHVGHGRGAAYGSSLANVLEAVGHSVTREYYINDGGRQMHILTLSIWLRYLQAHGLTVDFPSNGYQGDYITAFGQALYSEHGTRFIHNDAGVFAERAIDVDQEAYIDRLIVQARTLLGDADFQFINEYGLQAILTDIRDDLHEFGIDYQSWFSERSLMTSDAISTAIQTLKNNGALYEKDGALWFNTKHYGDDKDRVVVRDNGESTYFASDIAYHKNKIDRGFDRIINILGADHHGYIIRLKAALAALDIDPERLVVRLVQFANLYRGQERLAMSTRSGSFVTLRALREEVGNDAARFIYVTRKAEQHMDFDLELAKSASKDNPVYYVQYAHARLASVWRKLKAQGLSFDLNSALGHLDQLTLAPERDLVKLLNEYPGVVQQAADHYAPHQVATYLRELASLFHTYYNNHKLLVPELEIRQARLVLALATEQVLKNGLNLLGVSAPNTM